MGVGVPGLIGVFKEKGEFGHTDRHQIHVHRGKTM